MTRSVNFLLAIWFYTEQHFEKFSVTVIETP